MYVRLTHNPKSAWSANPFRCSRHCCDWNGRPEHEFRGNREGRRQLSVRRSTNVDARNSSRDDPAAECGTSRRGAPTVDGPSKRTSGNPLPASHRARLQASSRGRLAPTQQHRNDCHRGDCRPHRYRPLRTSSEPLLPSRRAVDNNDGARADGCRQAAERRDSILSRHEHGVRNR